MSIDQVRRYRKRWWSYVWTAPNSALGLTFGLLALIGGGHVQRVGPCLEFYGGWLPRVLRRLPTGQGAVAITLGHTIIGVSSEILATVRDHEWVHVRQYERWGPFFIPAYLLASTWLWFRGRHPYFDNPFEVEAFAKESRGAWD